MVDRLNKRLFAIIGALCSLFFLTGAYVPGGQQPGGVAIGVSGLTLYVDNVNGTDNVACGLATGSSACATPQQAYTNACVNYYPVHGTVLIQLANTGTNYGQLLAVGEGATDSPQPLCVGVAQVIIDGGGATSNVANINVYCRYTPLGITTRHITLISTTSDNIASRGGGCFVNLENGTIFGGCGAAYPCLLAYGGGQIAISPTSTSPSNSISVIGGGQYFAFAQENGAIQLEGAPIVISGTPAFTAFLGAGDNGVVSVAGVNGQITGNITGDQFYSVKGGYININGLTGGYSTCSDTFLPGSTCGQLYFGGRISDPGTATVSGCGTGATVTQQEQYSIITMGTGLGHTNGSQYTSCVLTMATRTNYQSCSYNQSSPVFQQVQLQPLSPTSTANGTWRVVWISNGTDPTTATIAFNCNT